MALDLVARVSRVTKDQSAKSTYCYAICHIGNVIAGCWRVVAGLFRNQVVIGALLVHPFPQEYLAKKGVQRFELFLAAVIIGSCVLKP